MTTKNEKLPAIFKSLDEVNQELQVIAKDQQGYGYLFRGIDQVLQNLAPLFKKHKIITRREIVKATRTIRVTAKGKEVVEVELFCNYIFTSLIDGSEFVTQGYNEGQDSSGGDKAASMATSNTYKYAIFEMFNIATAEQKDSDQVTAKEASKLGSAYRKTEVEDVL